MRFGENNVICPKYIDIYAFRGFAIQPILSKIDSMSFMFNNIFCDRNIKKVIHWEGGAGGKGKPS